MILLLLLALVAGCAAGPPPDADRDLTVRVVDEVSGDPSQLVLAVRWVTPDGTESLPADLDDEAGVVVLDGDQPLDDNAVYFDPDSGELMIDLDAMQGGDRRLRLRAQHGDAASVWLDVPVRDRRWVPGG